MIVINRTGPMPNGFNTVGVCRREGAGRGRGRARSQFELICARPAAAKGNAANVAHTETQSTPERKYLRRLIKQHFVLTTRK